MGQDELLYAESPGERIRVIHEVSGQYSIILRSPEALAGPGAGFHELGAVVDHLIIAQGLAAMQ